MINKTGADSFYSAKTVGFGSNKEEEAKDPYYQYPTRALAYTNEVGEALRPVPAIGNFWANALWVPAIGYFAADIYDKYKKGTDTTENDPRTAVSAAAFHTVASILSPVLAIKGAQWAATRKYGDKGDLVTKIFTTLQDRSSGLSKFAERLPSGEKMLRSLNKNAVTVTVKAVAGLATLAVLARPIDKLTERHFMKPVNRALGLDENNERHEMPVAAIGITPPEKLLTIQNKLRA